MVDNILTVLEGGDLTLKDLRKRTNLDEITLSTKLERLERQGLVIKTNRDKYRLVSKTNLKKAIICRKKNNTLVAKINKKEIKLLGNEKVSPKDIVLLEEDPRYSNNKETYGRIIKVIDKFKPISICVIEEDNNGYFVSIDGIKVKLEGPNLDRIPKDYVIAVEKNIDSNTANVIEVIGHKDSVDRELLPKVYAYGFNTEFSKSYLDELSKIPDEVDENTINNLLEDGFIDLRNKEIFTIDGDDTKDIDDAVSLTKNDNGTYNLIVSIALPAYYINTDSLIYQRVIEQGTSVYPVGKVIHLNHPKLSNGICSLNENSNRIALSYFVTFDKDGNTKNIKIKPSIINSNKKMTYNEVNNLLENNPSPEYLKYKDTLNNMLELKEILKKKMHKDGFLKFNNPEVKISADKEGNKEFTLRSNKDAEEIIEYFMLATNEAVSTYLTKRGLKLLYRIDEDPNQEKLNQVITFLSRRFNIREKEHYNNKDIQEILKLLEGIPEEQIFNSMLISCLSKARFSNENLGHYATGKKIYGMHTSPIRRACDFINQKIILDYLNYGASYTNDLWEDELEELATHFSEKEKSADELERDFLKREMALYLKNHIGEIHSGIISSVTDYGFYVRIDGIFEGLVNKRELGNTKYIPEIYAYLDKNTKHLYSLGDEVDIKIDNITDDFNIDFSLVGDKYEKEEKDVKKRVRTK